MSSQVNPDPPGLVSWAAPISVPPGQVASQRVAAGVRQAILAGRLPPGARIRQESLADEYGSSRLPVREALRMLEAEGLVTLVANTGAWVAQLSSTECEEMYRMRERIEPLLLRYSLRNLTADTVQELHQLAADMRTAQLEDFLRLDRQFHLLTYSGARTALLADVVQRLWNTTQHYRRAYTLLLDARSSDVLHSEHSTLAAVIGEGDSRGAERVLRGHIRRTRRRLIHHPELFR